MDFAKLAMAEVRRNPTRTLVAVIASALAAMIVILLRVIPEGYNIGVAMPERTFSGGDIIIFPAQAPLSSSDNRRLVWRNWHGRDWQSHLLYYFPETNSRGYFTGETCAGWRSMVPGEIFDKVKDIPNVKSISAYRSLPCVVRIGNQQIPAVLRGFDLETEYSIDSHVALGDPLDSENAENHRALVPLQARGFGDITPGNIIFISVPKTVIAESMSPYGKPLLHTGITWDEAKEYSFTVAGGYQIQVDEKPDLEAAIDSPGPPPMVPVFWIRPEVIISMDVFERIIEDLDPILEDKYLESFNMNFPSYQIALTVDRMSQLRQTTHLVRETLGSDYGVYPVPEALTYAARSRNHVVMPPNLHSVFSTLIIGFASVVVAGNIYIVVVQQKRKIGLLRVVGATSSNIKEYVLTLVAYVSAIGTLSGAVAGNFLYVVTLLGSDLSIKEWFAQALGDLSIIMGLSVGISTAIGLGIASWASRLSCSEVLSRE
ncbi:MAG TPA: ABC transporter permease [Firmicutes bacterium]|nr:ABC transporter permease [Bacillota bacterium]